MPEAGGRGGTSGLVGKTPGRKKDAPVVRDMGGTGTTTMVNATAPPKAAPAGTTSSTSVGRGKGSASASASSASSSANSYLAAQAKRDRAAQQRYLEDAARLNGQIAALRAALGPNGAFKDALKGRLKNIDEILGQQTEEMLLGFNQRWGSLDADQRNNERAQADSSNLSESNRSRERTMALAEAAMQGAGESDALRTQLMSLRNWEANQSEIDRAYHDGARSIVNSRIDLVNDTRTGLQNMALEADADRQQLWDDYWAQKSETQVALGNTLGQQAEYLGLAKEAGARRIPKGFYTSSSSSSSSSSSKGKGKGKGSVNLGLGKSKQPEYARGDNPFDPDNFRGGRNARWAYGTGPRPTGVEGGRPDMYGWIAEDTGPGFQLQSGGRGKGKGPRTRNITKNMQRLEQQSDAAFMAGTRTMGNSYDAQGIPEELQGWGPDIEEPKPLGSSMLQNARTTIAQQRPEGATLRKW